MERKEFDKWLDQFVETSARNRDEGMKIESGPSILELINNERLLSAGQYRIGLDQALYVIDKANVEGTRPYDALQKALKTAKKIDPEYHRGVETAFFIFTNPYKWIAGERV